MLTLPAVEAYAASKTSIETGVKFENGLGSTGSETRDAFIMQTIKRQGDSNPII